VRDHPPFAATERAAASLNDDHLIRDAQQQEADERHVHEVARDWRQVVRQRLFIVMVMLAVWTVAIAARLVDLQVIRYGEFIERAERQRSRTLVVPAKRGDLLDRHGRVLARSADGDVIVADLQSINDADREAVARQVCAAIEDCGPADRAQILDRLSRPRKSVYLWRRATRDDALRVSGLKIRGIGLLKEERRFYPNRELASHVLGFVGDENAGLAGIEAAQNSQISGRPGKVLLQTDANRNAYASEQTPPTAGAALELTLDWYLQYIAERELQAGVAEAGARGGSVVIMDPRSGEILALANAPTFNPNAFREFSDERRRNRAIQEIYEPGSTFKIVTAAAALEEHLVNPTQMFDVSPGYIRIGSRTINDVHAYGLLSFGDVIVKSSNVGAIKVGLRIGAERLGRYVKQFGFGRKALHELAGETQGIVWDPKSWNDSVIASVSMGYQVSVTPVQMAAAVSVVANGGELVAPRLVRAVIRDNHRTETPRRVVRRVITPETAATLTSIMESVVERGTAKAAQVEGYTIAGKTGTSAKSEPGGYSKSRYTASFVGFLPSRAPALAILIVIDEPDTRRGYYGGSVAAPVFKRLAEPAMRYLGIGPSIDPGPRILVTRQDPAAGTPDEAPQSPGLSMVRVVTDQLDPGVMPELRGMSAREAVRVLSSLGLRTAVEGDGFVVGQQPPPGVPVEPGLDCRILLERRMPAAATSGALP